MAEKQRALSDTPVSKNNPDALPVHPQVQTRYTQNITTIAKQWHDRFTTEATMQLSGKSYGKYEAGKLVPDLDADFWTNRSNAIIEQQTTSLLNQ